MENNALYHHGTKGMRWGIRRYQNKDGSLTPAGQKRYNKEVEKLKKETAKVKAAEKLAANNKKVQSKFDKLDAKKAALEARKKALKEGKDPEEEKKKAEESAEEKKARLLKSTNPKELYENRDMLTTMELNERLNRIDTEARLQGKIVVERQQTGMDYVDGLKTKIDKGVALYKSVDNAYSSVANSTIGKTLAKKLGLEPPAKEFDYADFIKNINKKSTQEVMEFNKRAIAENSGRKIVKGWADDAKAEADAKKAEKEAKEAEKKAAKEAKKAEKEAREAEEKAERLADAQRQVDEYIAKMYPEPEPKSSTTYSFRGDDIIDNRTPTGRNSPTVLLLEDKSATRVNEVPARVEDAGISYAEKWQQIYGNTKVKSKGKK